MTTGFNRTPVLPAGKRHAADGVHDTLVVGGGSKRVFNGKGMSFEDALDDVQTVFSRSVGRHFLVKTRR